MKKEARYNLTSDFPAVVIDPDAQTLNELMPEWPKSFQMLQRFVREQVDCGNWERVYKKVNGKITPAYRKKV